MVLGTRRRVLLVTVAVLLAAVAAVQAVAGDELPLPRYRLGPGGAAVATALARHPTGPPSCTEMRADRFAAREAGKPRGA